MRILRSSLVLAAALAFFPACGKKGPLLPPLVRIPQKIEMLSLCQRGEAIILEWTNPSAYTDGSPLLAVSKAEIWMLEKAKLPGQEKPTVTPDEFEKEARLTVLLSHDEFGRHLASPDKDKPPLTLLAAIPVPREKIDSSVLFFSLRVADSRGKTSEFTSLAEWKPLALPLPPSGLQVRMFEDRVVVRWEKPSANIDRLTPAAPKGYNIYRAAAGKNPVLLNKAPVLAEQYEDRDFVAATTYRYFVRATISDAAPYSESADSESIEAAVKDTFAPDLPVGLTAVASAGMITLVWDANGENDLAGYNVWRREAGRTADFVLLTPKAIAENSYSDMSVEKSVRYEYAISALDRMGNESRKSEIVSEIIKDEAR